jgi:hypothetical protein
MDKIFSARVDESALRRIGSLARQLNTTKKKILEEAIRLYAEKVDAESKSNVFTQTFGTWKRHANEITVGTVLRNEENPVMKRMIG